jgi:hypothetical protein
MINPTTAADQFILIITLLLPGYPADMQKVMRILPAQSQNECSELKREKQDEARRQKQQVQSIACYRKIN